MLMWVVSYAHPENFKKRYARPAPPIPISSMSSLLALLFLIDELFQSLIIQNRFEEEVFQNL